ncbi:substrate-binding periplasmic protein [Thalassotalea sediminis]|uniref:substrate-binding periplasmic protein n=1 Tax=Thalassotalea sediminis TaxID=1759089 RepID=UPI0025738294|nr:transporter substrate-binding domain-containing protein [Thalassotalea sediminis]
MKVKIWRTGLFVVFCSLFQAKCVFAQNVTVVAGLVKPPFIIEENGAGLQLDLMRKGLNKQGLGVNFYHAPNGRNITSYQRLNADIILTVESDYQHPSLYLSKPYVSYQNVVISLAENDFVIESENDLTNKVVVAFQNAKKYLGKDYRKAIDYVIDYREIPEQSKQVEMLFLRRTELIVIDINIFKYIVKHAENKVLFSKPYKVHKIFEPQHFPAAFKSKKMRDQFDQAISEMRENGEYQQIINHYIN